MSRTRKTLTAGLVAAALALPLGLAGPAHAAPRTTALGLVDGTTLVDFQLADPAGTTRLVGEITGFTGGDTELVGIDYRVQNRRLYGVGNQGGVYIFSSNARLVEVNRLSVALDGTSFAVDFNPAADRLRVISDTGQNLRHNLAPAEGTAATIADTPLTYPGAAGSTPGTGITAAAYTNNDLSADTGTVLYDIDTNLDQLAVQSPANAGLLSVVGKHGVDLPADTGFDIDPLNRGWLTTTAGDRSRLALVDLQTGKATLRAGAFPARYPVTDLAIRIGR